MCTIDKQALVDRLLAYVQIDSETGHEGAMSARLAEDFRALGCQVHTDEIKQAAQTDGANVYATLPGDPSLPPILLSAHMDTVVPGVGVKPRVCEDGYVRSDGTTVLGGDDKAGICAIMEAMKAAAGVPHRTVEAVITVREESGMFGAKNLDYSRIHAREALVLDGGGHAGNVVVAAPGQNKIQATILGRKAHAGIAPEEGISAIQVAAHAVAAMELLRVDFETTCNIGTFHADGPTNIVTERVELMLEVRSRDTGKLNRHTQHLIDCMEQACRKFGATLEHTVTTSYLGYTFQDSDPFVQRVLDAARKLGLDAHTSTSGGGSDANIFTQHGITALNMGVGMEKVHTTAEQQSIQDMFEASQLILELLRA